MGNVDSVNAEAISTLKKDVDRISNRIEALCPKGLFFWVIGFIILLCAGAFSTLLLLQVDTSKHIAKLTTDTSKDIAKLTTTVSRTQSDISRMLQIIDAGNFVKKDELERNVKGIVRQELYFFTRDHIDINNIKKR